MAKSHAVDFMELFMTLLPTIQQLLSMEPQGQRVIVRGWVRTKRETKVATFIEVNDGSSLSNIQCVLDAAQREQPPYCDVLPKSRQEQV